MPVNVSFQDEMVQNLKSIFLRKVAETTKCPNLDKVFFESVDVSAIPLVESVIPFGTILLAHLEKPIQESAESDLTVKIEARDDLFQECDDDEDLTGCPLESNFLKPDKDILGACLNIKSDQISQNIRHPLPVAEARLLINLYSLELIKLFKDQCPKQKYSRSLRDVPPLAVLCDQSDKGKMSLFGTARYNKCRYLNFQANVSEGTVSSGLPNLKIITAEHKQLFPQTNRPEVDVVSEYNILGSAFSSYLNIECQWQDAKEILSNPSPKAACCVKVKVNPNEDRSPLSALYKEVSILSNAVNALTTGEMEWLPYSLKKEHQCIDVVKDLINVVAEGRVWNPSISFDDHVDSNNLATLLENLALGNKYGGDFTDNLWLALRGCSSFQELQEALQYVVDSVHNRYIHPVVHYRNQTTLGKWLRKSTLDDTKKLNMTDIAKVFEMFAELGLEKLRNDYCNYFIGMELATQEHLKYYIKSSNLQEAALSILKLHIVLEMVMIWKSYLHLAPVHLGTFARKTLKSLESVDDPLSEDFETVLPVAFSLIGPLLKGLTSDKWQITFKSEDDTYNFQTTALFSRKPIFLLPDQIRRASSSDDSEPFYYAAVFKSSQGEL